MLIGIPKKNFVREEPFLISHNEFSQRSVPSNKNNLSNQPISFFGGSSTYDISISDQNSWVNQVGLLLKNKAYLINNGVPGYSSVEHLIQTSFFMNHGSINDVKCAVYYMGWNDIRNFGIVNVDYPNINYHLPSQAYTLRLAYIWSFSPTLRKISSFFPSQIAIFNNDVGELIELSDKALKDDLSLKAAFTNIENILALNNSKEIKSIFIPQILNFNSLKSETAYGWIPKVADKDLYKLILYFNKKVGKIFEDGNQYFLDIDYSLFNAEDFVDQGHFSMIGAKKFADLISNDIYHYCFTQRETN